MNNTTIIPTSDAIKAEVHRYLTEIQASLVKSIEQRELTDTPLERALFGMTGDPSRLLGEIVY